MSKHLFRILTFGVVLSLLATKEAHSQFSESVIRGGWWFDSVDEAFVRNSGIVVRGGKFQEIGVELSKRDLSGAEVIDLGEDDYILPGIFDLHAHYNVNLVGKGRRDEWTVNPVIFLANGVTSTFPAGEFNPEEMMVARKRIDSGKQIGPRIFNSGPYFGSARSGWNRDATIQDIYDDVDLWAERGAGGFKAKGISPEHLQALIDRAHVHGLTVTGHLGSGFRSSVNPRDAILMGIDRIEHFLGGDALPADKSAYASLVDVKPGTPELKRIVDLFINRHVYFDATLTAYGYYGERKEGYDYWTDEQRFFTPYVHEYMKSHSPRRSFARFETIYWVKRETIKAFYEAGGRDLITLGTDHPSTGEYLSGFSAHRELEAFVLSGIPPAAAIRFATINGARALNVGEKLGSIEAGKFADLFVVRGNPLGDIRNSRNVRLVMKSGRIHDPVALLRSVEGEMGPKDESEAEDW